MRHFFFIVYFCWYLSEGYVFSFSSFGNTPPFSVRVSTVSSAVIFVTSLSLALRLRVLPLRVGNSVKLTIKDLSSKFSSVLYSLRRGIVGNIVVITQYMQVKMTNLIISRGRSIEVRKINNVSSVVHFVSHLFMITFLYACNMSI